MFTSAPNAYRLPDQLGRTIEGGKKQAPVYSLRGRQKIGSFHEDLQKVDHYAYTYNIRMVA